MTKARDSFCNLFLIGIEKKKVYRSMAYLKWEKIFRKVSRKYLFRLCTLYSYDIIRLLKAAPRLETSIS